jgi:hypothetical protein
MKKLLLTAFSLASAFAAHAQLQPAKQTPESSELWSPVPRVVTPGKITPALSGFSAPSDAIVLFDGKNLDAWVSGKDGKSAAPWTVGDNAITVAPKSGDIQTKQTFGDYQLHIEWRTPAKVEGSSQGRGNSGIFMQGCLRITGIGQL